MLKKSLLYTKYMERNFLGRVRFLSITILRFFYHIGIRIFCLYRTRQPYKHTFIVHVIPRDTERTGFVINYVRKKFSDKNVFEIL